jgi:hypothetical protein
MATTQNTFNGNGSNLGPFSFTFKWLESTDIKVSVGGVLKTAGTHYNLQGLNYTTKTGGQVLFTAGNAPPVGTNNIRIYRDTDDEALSAVFSSGSAIRAKDLNDNFTQNLYVTQETNNNSLNVDGSNPMVGPLNMNGFQINNLAAPTSNTNAATKQYVDDIAISGLPNIIPSANVVFTQSGTGAVQRTVESKLQDTTSVLDFIPQSEHAAIKAGTSTYNCSPAFNAALAASDFVFVPKGGYRIESTILVKAGQKLIGTGRSTVLKGYVPAPNPIVQLGADVGSLNYYPALESFQINQYTPNGVAVLLFETCGGTVKDIFVNGEVDSGCIGFVIDAHDNSSFFNLLQNCYALHCHIGFDFIDTGSSFSTQNILIDCSVFGDLLYGDTTSIGYKFTQGPNGQDTCVYGGNLEQCGIGIKLETVNKINFHGVRFEANTEDINMNALVSDCSFINCRNIAVATGAPGAQDGYGNNTFFACDGAFGKRNYIEAETTYYSSTTTDTPLRVFGYPGQTAPLQRWLNSSGVDLFRVNANGGIFTNDHISLAGAGSGGSRYLALLNETSTYTGSYVLQAGGGSASFGGAITMYGHAHVTYPGSVYIGTSAGSGGSLIFGTDNALSPAGERFRVDPSGRMLIGTTVNSGGALLQVNGDRIRVATAKTPASATDTGTAGEICWDANYVYVCTATNTWKRAAVSTW